MVQEYRDRQGDPWPMGFGVWLRVRSCGVRVRSFGGGGGTSWTIGPEVRVRVSSNPNLRYDGPRNEETDYFDRNECDERHKIRRP